MFDNNNYQEQSIFSNKSNNSINFNLFFDSSTKTDLFNYNELNCDYIKSSTNKKETLSTESDNETISNNVNNNKGFKQNIFSIEKKQKTSTILKSKTKYAKRKGNKYHSLNHNLNSELIDSEMIDKNKIWQIIDNEIYPSQINLTPKERVYLKKLKNRITAQKSRDKMKYHFELLQKTNESLNKEIEEKDEVISALTNIISSCSFCSDKAADAHPHSSFNITQSNSGVSVRSMSRLSVKIGSLLAIVCCFFLLFSFQSTTTYKNIVRKLVENEEDNYIKIRYQDNNTKCCAEDILFNNYSSHDNNYFLKNVFVVTEPNKTEMPLNKAKALKRKNSFVCKEYLSAKLSNELNFDLIYNKKKRDELMQNYMLLNDTEKALRFKMVIPVFKYQNDFKPYIISMSSNDYINQIQKMDKYAYYEVICEINNITKIIGQDDN